MWVWNCGLSCSLLAKGAITCDTLGKPLCPSCWACPAAPFNWCWRSVGKEIVPQCCAPSPRGTKRIGNSSSETARKNERQEVCNEKIKLVSTIVVKLLLVKSFLEVISLIFSLKDSLNCGSIRKHYGKQILLVKSLVCVCMYIHRYIRVESAYFFCLFFRIGTYSGFLVALSSSEQQQVWLRIQGGWQHGGLTWSVLTLHSMHLNAAYLCGTHCSSLGYSISNWLTCMHWNSCVHIEITFFFFFQFLAKLEDQSHVKPFVM